MAETLMKTGIAGLDEVFIGGIPRDNTILVQGAAGVGKSLLGMEFIYRGITAYNEPGVIVLFETSPDKLVRDALQFGWNLEQLLLQNKLKIVFTSPQVLALELLSPDSLLLETAADIGARRIFIDGIGLMRPSASNGHPLPANGPGSYRELLQQLLEGMKREKLTAMISHEISKPDESLGTLETATFLADTVIQLEHDRLSRLVHRSVEIIKSRGQEYVTGKHTLRITGGRGLEVFRRVQAPILRDENQPTSSNRTPIGVAALDELTGGFYDGSTTMLIGVSGTGKSVLSAQLLVDGAVKYGKRGLLISLDEHPAQIVRNAASVNIDLKAQIDSGMVHILYDSPQEMEIDRHYARIVQTIEKYNIQRLVLDGVTTYSTAIDDQRGYRDFFHALVAFCKFRLMTTFFNYENPEVFGLSSYMPAFPVNSIVDNIVVLSIVELGHTLHRCISVVKARGSRHDFDTREFKIGEGGVSLVPLDDSAKLTVLPVESYSSVISRAPTRVPPPRGTVPLANRAGSSR